MPKYLIEACYTAEGAKGVIAEGASSRRRKVEQTLAGLNGKLEAFYYAFGETDVFLIIDLPDAVSAMAMSMAINQSGAVTSKTHVLMSTDEVDQAAKKSVSYQAPGR